MRRAGFPATIEYGATSDVTTAHAETMLPSPMVTPGKITARPPIQTLSAINDRLDFVFGRRTVFETSLRIGRVAVGIKHPHAGGDSAMAHRW